MKSRFFKNGQIFYNADKFRTILIRRHKDDIFFIEASWDFPSDYFTIAGPFDSMEKAECYIFNEILYKGR